MKLLKYGSVGPSVELLQLALRRAGAQALNIDGVFGSATKDALRIFRPITDLRPTASRDLRRTERSRRTTPALPSTASIAATRCFRSRGSTMCRCRRY